MMALATLIFLTVLQSPAQVQQPPNAIAHGQAVLAAVVAGDFAKVEAEFTSDMKAAWPSGRLAAAWAGLQIQAGAYKSCGSNPRVITIADKQMVISVATTRRRRRGR
jgi:hypothetical protein